MLQYSMDPGYTYAYMVHCLIQSSKIFPLLHQQNFIFTVDSWILPKAKLGEFSWLCHQHANSCSTLLMVCQSAQLGGVNNMNLTSLYNGASLSMGTSSWAIMLFSISNKLTYSAMAEILELSSTAQLQILALKASTTWKSSSAKEVNARSFIIVRGAWQNLTPKQKVAHKGLVQLLGLLLPTSHCCHLTRICKICTQVGNNSIWAKLITKSACINICDPLGEKGPFGKYRLTVSGQEHAILIFYHFHNFITIWKFSLFSSFWYAIYAFYTKISTFNNKKKSNSQLPCTRVRTRSSKIGNW